ncbi:MAG: WecB/TagA/CpsF family glycosyltransferase [Spirochaetaceae bacterium]|nr:WecB/TagA/CpsF family glycosyltransferase [Spirochaetaceae bacterium]
MDIEAGDEEAGPVSAKAAERISLLKVPLDIVPQEQLPDLILELLRSRSGGNIVLLSLWDLLKARRSGEYRDYVLGASLVIPITKSLVSGAKFLTGKTPIRYMPFDFVVSLLTVLEKREFSVYLLGGSAQVLRKTEKNVRQTFPQLRIVGRRRGGIKRQEEAALVQAIHKAAPSLLLVGRGFRGEERWIARNYRNFSPGLRLWCSDLFDVFAERRKRPSRAVFDRGFEWLAYYGRKPWLFLRVFPWFYYKILLLAYRLFVRTQPLKQAQPL